MRTVYEMEHLMAKGTVEISRYLNSLTRQYHKGTYDQNLIIEFNDVYYNLDTICDDIEELLKHLEEIKND